MADRNRTRSWTRIAIGCVLIALLAAALALAGSARLGEVMVNLSEDLCDLISDAAGCGHSVSDHSWYRLLGDAGEAVSLEHFGASADTPTLFREFGITADAVAAATRRSLNRVNG
ncbi:hypothetical protein [Rhodococcus opacus]|uniref:hypothetical protein n=1 Tax=Rhodococcus opacus TaxID=37919 RepID=UPI001F5469D0|nr:hypothetical protein [Rhodococcus opacus]